MMKITENSRQTEIYGSYDVVVAGGGFAGISAALAARRNGARVLLLEKEFILGGLGTAGLVTIYLPLCDGCGNQLSFGIAEELLHLSMKEGYEARYPKAWLEGGTKEERSAQRFMVQYNAGLFAVLAEQLLLSEGVEILYGTYVCGANVEDGKITHLFVENKSGRLAIEARAVVDCTGDADVCALAGERTAIFKKGNLLAAWYYLASPNGYDLIQHGVCDGPGAIALENRRYTGIDGKELSEMTFSSHRELLKHFLKKGKLSKEHMLASIATIPQIRMTRRIDGDYVMDDTEIRKRFDDSVGMFGDWRKSGPAYELPFATLHGSTVKNLAAAGRCISVTDAMWDITRVIPVCAVSGEAAGTAAAMFDDFTKADIKALQTQLSKQGVKLH